MKSSSFQQAIQAQFDCLTKKVIKRAAMKYNRDISRRLKHEVPFSEISDLELNKAGVYYCLPSQDKHSGRITKNDGGGISMDKDHKHIPFAVIVAATNGDEAAIQEILDFYDGYISKLSLRKLYDEYGNVYMVVDSELKGRIQAAVMDMIANFDIVVI